MVIQTHTCSSHRAQLYSALKPDPTDVGVFPTVFRPRSVISSLVAQTTMWIRINFRITLGSSWQVTQTNLSIDQTLLWKSSLCFCALFSKIVKQSPAAPCVAVWHLCIDCSRDIGTSHRTDVNIDSVLHLGSLDQEWVRRWGLIGKIAGLPFAIEDSNPGRIWIVFLDNYEVLVPKTGQVRVVLVVYPLFHIQVVLSQRSSRNRKLYTSSLEWNPIGGVQLPSQRAIGGCELAGARPSVRNGLLFDLPGVHFVDGGRCICMSGQDDGHAKFVHIYVW